MGAFIPVEMWIIHVSISRAVQPHDVLTRRMTLHSPAES